jgi:hypothetical protein
MKNIVVITALFALSFATGFTCSKNAPEQAAQTTTESVPAAPADQAAMAASGDATATAAATPASADGSAPAAPTETK